MLGHFDRARDLYRRGQALLRELGPSVSAMVTSLASARVESLAGALDTAEQELRRDERDLQQIGEQYFHSSIAGALARVLLRQEKLEEAERFADLARELADPDDADPQVLWRSVRAGLLARDGDGDAAIELMEEAVRLASATDDAILRAEVLLDQSDLLRLLGRSDTAEPPLRAALELFTQKGDVVSAERIRDRLAATPAA
jgi:ATP/maltotriose-dependent transcriptional regulator MalT